MRIEENNIYNIPFQEGLKYISNLKMIVTDPPYNIDFSYNEYNDKLSDDDYIKLLENFKNMPTAIIQYPEETMKYVVPALGVPSEVVVWCYNSNLSKQSRLINFFNCEVDFKKVKQPYKNPNDKRVKKLIDGGSTGTRLYDWFSDIQIVKNTSKEKFNHPCPVPVELMKRIILLTTNEGDLVCDPFIGSGTTAVACIETNRKFIGFEIDKNYFEESKIKINQALERKGY